jgi:hypothetical protein
MATYNVLLQTNGANEARVNEWISIWLDSSGGTWGDPEASGPDAWGINVENFNYDEERLRAELQNTMDNGPGGGELVKFAVSAG